MKAYFCEINAGDPHVLCPVEILQKQRNGWRGEGGCGGSLRLPQCFAVFTTGQDSKHKDVLCGRILIQLPACRLLGKASGIPTATVNKRGGASREALPALYVVVKRGVAQQFSCHLNVMLVFPERRELK